MKSKSTEHNERRERASPREDLKIKEEKGPVVLLYIGVRSPVLAVFLTLARIR